MNSDSSAPPAKRLRLMSAPDAAPEKNDDVISGGLVLPPEVWARVSDCKFMHAWYYVLSCQIILVFLLNFCALCRCSI